jgi:octaprenyl-diphosphate synthase
MDSSDPLAQIYAPVAQEFETLNHCILEQLHSKVQLIDTIGHYLVQAGGKRLRPLLVLLSACHCGYRGKDHIPLAAIIEFLHTATLLHDDVVDESSLRRGRETANAKWGNAPSVLVGDFLYSRAFQMMVSLGSVPVMQVLSNATNIIAEGEVLQLMNVHEPDTSEATYLEVIHFKTAMLFEASAHASALLASPNRQHVEAMRQFGLNLGMAFQLTDDVLDFSGDAGNMGKNVGDDLAEGKPTLPLIYTMKHAPAKQAALVKRAIETGGLEHLEAVIQAVNACGALDYTTQLAHKYVRLGADALAPQPQSPYKQTLSQLLEFSIHRVI